MVCHNFLVSHCIILYFKYMQSNCAILFPSVGKTTFWTISGLHLYEPRTRFSADEYPPLSVRAGRNRFFCLICRKLTLTERAVFYIRSWSLSLVRVKFREHWGKGKTNWAELVAVIWLWLIFQRYTSPRLQGRRPLVVARKQSQEDRHCKTLPKGFSMGKSGLLIDYYALYWNLNSV